MQHFPDNEVTRLAHAYRILEAAGHRLTDIFTGHNWHHRTRHVCKRCHLPLLQTEDPAHACTTCIRSGSLAA